MTTERRDPVRELVHLRERIEHLFQDVLGRSAFDAGAPADGGWRPPVDVWVEGDRYKLRVDLPGVAPEDLTIEIEGSVLHVLGQRRDGGPPRDQILRAERPQGRFAVAITLPPSVDPQGVEAHQHDGVLEIALRRVAPGRAGRVRVALK